MNIMKKLLLLIIFVAAGCSSDNEECHKCTATFYNQEFDAYIIYEADCNHASPGNGYVFVSCEK